MAIYLSYSLLTKNPSYGKPGGENLELKRLKSLSKGDSCNTFSLTLNNHLGTHVDCPAHFFAKGAKVADYPADFWLFCNPQVISINAQAGKLVIKKDITAKIKPDTDLLLFRSGWSKFRSKKTYVMNNPGLDPELAVWIRKDLPFVRAVGIDWLSISSYKHRDIGRQAHRSFLDPEKNGHPVIIIEDMFIPDKIIFKQVLVCPLRADRLDSAPCTIIGF